MPPRQKTTALDWSPEDETRLTKGDLPRGPELVRIRTELVGLCRLHCCARTVREAEMLLLWAELDNVAAK